MRFLDGQHRGVAEFNVPFSRCPGRAKDKKNCTVSNTSNSTFSCVYAECEIDPISAHKD